MKKFILSLVLILLSFGAFAQEIQFDPFGLTFSTDLTTQISLTQLTFIQDALKSAEKERDEYKALYEKEHEENIQFRKEIEKLLSEQKDSITSAETSVDNAIVVNDALADLNRQLAEEARFYKKQATTYKWIAIGTTVLCIVTGTTITVMSCMK